MKMVVVGGNGHQRDVARLERSAKYVKHIYLLPVCRRATAATGSSTFNSHGVTKVTYLGLELC